MPIAQDLDLLTARHLIAAALATALSDPRTARSRLRGPHTEPDNLREAWNVIVERWPDLETASLGLGELPPAKVEIDGLIDWLAAPKASREAAYVRVFGLVVCHECSPYETEYCHWTDPTYRSHQLADIAGFYKAFGLEPTTSSPERHDHVALELEFIAFLLQKTALLQRAGPSSAPAGLEDEPARSNGEPARSEHETICREALEHFIKDHIAWWVPTFARCVEQRIAIVADLENNPRHRRAIDALTSVTRVTRAWAAVERLANGVEPSRQIIAPQVEVGALADEEPGPVFADETNQ